ncbi:Crp/Fnr family transcriptional regulator [Anaerotignum sp. MB30-C6]|uniref:Crp/Fnr family transcriptional regulator n=1 Tax=Anaerotignum sp. MB30-C6 TaxID=3070814 RepID=UPI0027DB67DF|nr:Crp/Fnr family transcriptional regulator [Anaerotignum sp. MB30-C6]WMI80556.1 Crp/Fnr family transcriptional regulator [Anaerotignum sp. MB30-C6]
MHDVYLKQLQKLPLFVGIKKNDIDSMLACLGSYVRSYKKGELIFLAGETVKHIGIILSGSVSMIKEDIWGTQTLIAFMKTGEVFGETFACGNLFDSNVTFSVSADCKILFLPFYKIIHSCNMSCTFHHRLIENMVRLISSKNIQLIEKIEVTSKKTLREKILTYLLIQAKKQGCEYFDIPLGRLELAAYLCADRSALTRELSQMRSEGLLDFEKNTFHLLELNNR